MRTPSRRVLLGALGVLVIVVIVVVLLIATGGKDKKAPTTRIGPGGFNLAVPAGWERVARPANADPQSGPIVLAFRKKDGTGFLVVHQGGPLKKLDTAFARSVNGNLKKRVPDYHAIKTQRLRLADGDALFFSYVRTKQGNLVTITVVPGRKRSYVIDTASRATDKATAAEIGAIIRSFKLR